ncbi:MAG: RagB/SusD family nutrient uptake outer membrane protein [Bacteroidales bacterium]|nr:RagB/SusD family nutrient uptake outer membrane protein [Bacteroidales bacterium]
MKLYKFIAIAFASAALAACSDITDLAPQGGTLLDKQVKETTAAIPSRADASFTGMYFKMSNPLSVGGLSSRPDNFGFAMIDFSTDLEAADMLVADSGYNWFSVCGDLSSRTANYANPYIRYAAPYATVANANAYIMTFDVEQAIADENTEILAKIAQAKAVRAYAYLMIAPYFQFNQTDADLSLPCIPLVNEFTEDFTNNPRATVQEVYDQIFSDLDFAIEYLEGYTRPDKAKIDQQVAYGLRARANLNMRKYAEALSDAQKAAEGYQPATIEELSKPAFYDINDHNWMWGYDQTVESASSYPFATPSSWVRSFSAFSYSAACQVYACCNSLLWNKIPETDVRKGWWVDENLQSPLLKGLAWPGFPDVANADDGGDSKTVFLPYTNVKFGCVTIATDVNEEDWPMMRVEEMILIQAECLARTGKDAEAVKVLNNFIKTYRDPEYDAAVGHCANLLDEIWFQRRVELWGEGFSNNDTRRLAKPLVRFHDGTNNYPTAFRFNMDARDGWWLMRFPQSELNTNLAVKDNVDGKSPVLDQMASLRDGVTD